MTYYIPFARFSLPNGRRSEDSMRTADPDVVAAYERIRAAGFYCSVEILSTREIAAYISDGTSADMGDIDCLVHPNGPGLPEAIGAMMKGFTAEGAAEWRKAMDTAVSEEVAAEELAMGNAEGFEEHDL